MTDKNTIRFVSILLSLAACMADSFWDFMAKCICCYFCGNSIREMRKMVTLPNQMNKAV